MWEYLPDLFGFWRLYLYMTQNPLINALSASLYIIGLVSLIELVGPDSQFDNVGFPILPMVMLSIFVLSAAVMGYLFCYQPLKLFLEGKKEEAVGLFLKTVGVFACVTLALFGTLFLLS